MKVILYTVPGTGTRFMANILESVYGYREVDYTMFKVSDVNEDFYTRLHTNPEDREHQLFNNISGRVVTTLRDPVLAYLSRAETMVSKEQAWTVNDSACRWARLMNVVEVRRFFCFPVSVGGRMFPPGFLAKFAAEREVWIDRLTEHIKPTPSFLTAAHNFALQKLLKDWDPMGESAETFPDKKGEYLTTGRIEGIDLTPLDAARAWVKNILGGSVSGSVPAGREA